MNQELLQRLENDRKAFEKAAGEKWHTCLEDTGKADWQEKWFLDGLVGSAENSEDGLTLSAGSRFGNDAHHVVLWTKGSF